MAESKIKRHLECMEVRISDIQPYKNNPKAHTLEQIAFVADLIQTYGWTQPICLDKNYEVVFGHCRLESAKSLGETTVPCVFREDLTEAQVKALRIADNKSNESEWITERLEIELVELQAFDIDLKDVGFGFEERPGGGHLEEDDFDVDRVLEEEPITQVGDLWLLSEHRVLCGDSTKAEDVERVMNGEKADMVFTDPPFDFEPIGSIADSIAQVSANTNIVIMLKDKKLVEYLKVSPFEFHRFWVCDIEFPVFLWVGPLLHHILIAHESQGKPLNYKDLKDGFRSIVQIKYRKRLDEDKFHLHQKAVADIAKFIEHLSDAYHTVVDIFLGTGTTLLACEQLKRTCYGIEISPNFCDVIVKRWMALTGEEARVERAGQVMNFYDLQKPA